MSSSDAESDDEQPELDESEIAEIPDDVAEEIESGDPGDDGGDADDGDESRDDLDDGALDAPDEDSLDSDRTSAGDIYCNGLGMMAAVGRTTYGSADEDDRSELVEEYAEIARDLDIDGYVDDYLEEQGGIDELSPGQAVLVTTLLWGGMVAMDDPDMLEGLADA